MSEQEDVKDRLELALKASNEGVWDWDLAKDEIFYSNRVLRFLGYGRYEVPNIFSDPIRFVHPESRGEWTKQLEAALSGKEDLFAMEAQIQVEGDAWCWFRTRGVARKDESGKVVRLVGSLIDISKRKVAETALEEERARIDLLLESVPVNVYLKDRDSRFLRVNEATAERMGAASVEEVIGKSDRDFFGSEHAEEAREGELRIMETLEGQVDVMEHEVWEDGHETWVMVTKMPWIGIDGEVKGTFGVTNDVTELVEIQNRLADDSAQLAGANQVIEEERHRLRLLIDSIPMFVYFKDLESRFVLVNQGMADLFGLNSPAEVVGKHDRDFFSNDIQEEADSDEQRIMETGIPMPTKLERIAWKDGHVTWSMSSKFPWYDKEGELVGTFGVSGDVTELVETRDQLAQVAMILGRKNEVMEEELQLAREVQQASIPKSLPIFRGAEHEVIFTYRYESATELAGDFFEVVPLGNDKAGFLVCDVMGHGVRAALVVSMLRGLMEKGSDLRDEPGLFLAGLNDGLCHLLERTGLTMFATAIYGVVDLEAKTVRLASAGHPAPLVRCGGNVEELTFPKGSKGPALGLVAEAFYGEVALPFSELSALWCFTDGIYEVQDKNGEELGSAGMAGYLEEGTLESLVESARNYSVDGVFDDDVCVLGLELRKSCDKDTAS
ncbi:PAS domain-containing protein [Akkermansiaceae bacterium]|nr:PAS domain-containing protein [Akkermansiaceae bacterium]MDB4619925.1 PAS domain-containing protein [Akkermansiaceae bacterium]MDB4692874.1 PAS domain-containing protein [Akkermansiaceae bacterium]MDC1405484.1 PAS domain-containing protein [Akkermansiaceae bacterium]